MRVRSWSLDLRCLIIVSISNLKNMALLWMVSPAKCYFLSFLNLGTKFRVIYTSTGFLEWPLGTQMIASFPSWKEIIKLIRFVWHFNFYSSLCISKIYQYKYILMIAFYLVQKHTNVGTHWCWSIKTSTVFAYKLIYASNFYALVTD